MLTFILRLVYNSFALIIIIDSFISSNPGEHILKYNNAIPLLYMAKGYV